MIGDAKARGARHSTKAHGPEFKRKNSEGQSHKHVDGPRMHDGGGDHENTHSARRANRGMAGQRGMGVKDGQKPHKQVERKEVEHLDQGNIRAMARSVPKQLDRKYVEDWCGGKRGNYK